MVDVSDIALKFFLSRYFVRENLALGSHDFSIEIGWSLLKKFDKKTALKLARAGFRIFVKPDGKFGYHETITVAYMLLILNRQSENPDRSYQEFKENNKDLFERGFKILYKYYSEDLLWSEQSRKVFCDGDISKIPNPYNLSI